VVGTVDLVRSEFAHGRRVTPITTHAAAKTIFDSCLDQRTGKVTWRSFGHCLAGCKRTLALDEIAEFDTFALVEIAITNRDVNQDGALDFAEFKSALDSICRKSYLKILLKVFLFLVVAGKSFGLLWDLNGNDLTFDEYSSMASNLQTTLYESNNIYVEDKWIAKVRGLFDKVQMDEDLAKLSTPELAKLVGELWAISL